MNYTYEWRLKDKGYTEFSVEDYPDWVKEEKDYVDKYLSPSIEHAKCERNKK